MPLINLICPTCDTSFQLERWDVNGRKRKAAKRGVQKDIFCSKSCAITHSNLHRYEKRELCCPNCGKTEIVNDSHCRKKYCSHFCYIDHNRVRLSEFAGSMARLFGKQACQTRSKNWENGKTVHGRLGKILTQDSKNKISEARLKFHETNPGYWLGKKMSAASRQKMSASRSKLILTNGFLWKTSSFFSKKNNEEIFCRSSWEHRYFWYLETRLDVKAYKTEPFALPYEHEGNRLYHPDVLITFTDGRQELHEVKPAYYVNYPINQAKFKVATQYCQSRNIPFRVITEREMQAIA